MRAVQDQFQTMQWQIQQQNAELQRQATKRQLAQAQATPLGTVTPGVDGKYPLASVSRWSPDFCKGNTTEWRQWSSKFCAFVGGMHGGQVGKWLHEILKQVVEQNRSNSSEAAAPTLHAAPTHIVEGRAFVMVDRSGGEKKEAWRKLLEVCEPRLERSMGEHEAEAKKLDDDLKTGVVLRALPSGPVTVREELLFLERVRRARTLCL
eukprot:920255-Amphidinium_carterae.2